MEWGLENFISQLIFILYDLCRNWRTSQIQDILTTFSKPFQTGWYHGFLAYLQPRSHGFLPLSDSPSRRMNQRQMTLGTKLVSKIFISIILRKARKYSATIQCKGNKKTRIGGHTNNTRKSKKQLIIVEQGFFEILSTEIEDFFNYLRFEYFFISLLLKIMLRRKI